MLHMSACHKASSKSTFSSPGGSWVFWTKELKIAAKLCWRKNKRRTLRVRSSAEMGARQRKGKNGTSCILARLVPSTPRTWHQSPSIREGVVALRGNRENIFSLLSIIFSSSVPKPWEGGPGVKGSVTTIPITHTTISALA